MKQAKVKPVSLTAIVAAGAQFPFQASDLDGDKFIVLAKGKDGAFFGTDDKGDSVLLNGEEEAYTKCRTPLYDCFIAYQLNVGGKYIKTYQRGGILVADIAEARASWGNTNQEIFLGEEVIAYRD